MLSQNYQLLKLWLKAAYITSALLLAVSAALLVAPIEAQSPHLAYFNNFEGAVGGEWSSSSTDVTPVGGRRFLGQFQNQTVTLTLNNLPPHTHVRLSFDLFLIRSWDGNMTTVQGDREGNVGPIGPDIWNLSVGGTGRNLLHTTFSNINDPAFRQAYPGSYPGGSFAGGEDHAEIDSLGYDFHGDTVYRLNFIFPHSAKSLVLNFSASGLQKAILDESWGLDNVQVSLGTGQTGFKSWHTQVMEPITLPSGNFITQHTDLMVNSLGMPLTFARTYNAQLPLNGPLGYGWMHNYLFRIEEFNTTLFNGVAVTYPDGNIAYFTDVGGSLIAPSGNFDTLTRTLSGYSLITPERIEYTFDAQGHLLQQKDRNNNTLSFNYNGDDLTTITDTAGRLYALTHDASGHITSITDPIGRTIGYSYSPAGDLERVRLTDGGELQYTYDNQHRLVSINDPNGHTFVTNVYDDMDRVIEQRDAAGSVARLSYADDFSQVVLTDNENQITIYQFDSEFRLGRETDALGHSMQYEYDAQNNRTLVVEKSGNQTHYGYDKWGNIVSILDANGGQTTMQFQNGRDLVYFRDANGTEITATYNLSGNLAAITTSLGTTQYEHDLQGLIERITDPNGDSTLLDYDTQGNVISITDAKGNVTMLEYDGVSRLVRVTDANNHGKDFTYDAADRLIETIDPKGNRTVLSYDLVGNLRSITNRTGHTKLFSYDVNDQLLSVSDELGFVTYFTYDKMYHLTSTTDPRGATTFFEYDAVYNIVRVRDRAGAVTQYEFNPDHQIVAVVDPLGNHTQLKRDALHRVVQIVDPLNQTTDITYDAVGQILSIRDARGGITSYTYHPIGVVSSVTDAMGGLTRFEYDSRGNLINIVDALNHATQYDYDELNRLIETTDALNQSESIQYDSVGNIVEVTDKRGFSTQLVYDENDNLLEVKDAETGVTGYTYDAEERLLSVTNPNSHTTNFGYDARGDLTSIQLPEGELTELAYDGNGNIVSVKNSNGETTQFRYDPRDLLEAIIDPLGNTTRYTYDPLERLVRMVDAEGHHTKYDFDALDRLSAVIENFVDGQPFNEPNFPDRNLRTTYTYDPLGALLSITDANGNTQSFSVDLLGRITHEIDALGNTWRYEYDASSNVARRIDANNTVTTYTYDELNRRILTAYSDGSEAGFTYDPNSNLIQMTDPSGQTDMEYDALNRLVEVTKTSPLTSAITFQRTFDSAGNLTAIEYPDGRKLQFAYDQNEWLTNTIDPLSGVTSYSYDGTGALTDLQYPNGASTHRTYDAAGRLVSLVNEGANGILSAFSYSYDKVGNRTQVIETLLRLANPPVANDDTGITNVNTPLLLDILVNDTDADGDTLRIVSVAPLSNGTVVINPDNTITFTPNSGFIGTVTFGYTITDDAIPVAGQDVAQVTVTVQKPNQPPTINNPGGRSNLEGEPILLQISASDPDGNALTYSASGLPDELTLDSASGLISGTLGFDSAGTYTVNVEVFDNGFPSLGATTSFVWTVTNVNRPPTIAPPENQTNTEGDYVSLQIIASDPDNDVLRYDADHLPTGVTIDPESGLIMGTINGGAAGTYLITVVVIDLGGLSADATFEWVVNASTNPPAAPTNLTATAISPTQIDLAWVDNAVDETGFEIERSVDGVTNFTFLASVSANTTSYPDTSALPETEHCYRVRAVNAFGASDYSNVACAVTPPIDVNEPPAIVNPGDQTNEEGSSVSLPIVANDPDGDLLRYSALGLPSTLIIDPVTGLIIGDIAIGTAANSPYAITVTVTDPEGLSASTTFLWTITQAQHLQLTSLCPRGQFKVYNPHTVAVEFTWDIEGTTLMGSGIVSASEEVLFNTGVSAGIVRLLVNGLVVDTEPTINNCPPDAQDDAVTTDTNVPVNILVLANDVDPDGNPLTVVSVTTPSHGTAVVNADNSILYTPNVGFAGIDVFEYFVSDLVNPNEGQDAAKVTITVNPPQPVCTAPNPDTDLNGSLPSRTHGIVSNSSPVCSYLVGIASYKRYDDVLDNQDIFDWDTAIVAPGQTIDLYVEVPTCALQVDLFYGDPILGRPP